MLITYLFTKPEFFLIWILCVIIAISVHEFAHAYASYLEGDSTAQSQGRLTFNPMAHIDLVGLLLLVLIGFGWGKPVPFNPYNLKHKRWGPAIVSLAGPFSNLLMVILVGIALKLIVTFGSFGAENLLITFLISLIQINVILMVFNLIPIPPLDGSKVLYTFLSFKHQKIIVFLETYGMWMLLGLIFIGGDLLNYVFNFFYNLVLAILL